MTFFLNLMSFLELLINIDIRKSNTQMIIVITTTPKRYIRISIHLQWGDSLVTSVNGIHHESIYLSIDENMRSVNIMTTLMVLHHRSFLLDRVPLDRVRVMSVVRVRITQNIWCPNFTGVKGSTKSGYITRVNRRRLLIHNHCMIGDRRLLLLIPIVVNLLLILIFLLLMQRGLLVNMLLNFIKFMLWLLFVFFNKRISLYHTSGVRLLTSP